MVSGMLVRAYNPTVQKTMGQLIISYLFNGFTKDNF